MGVNVQTNNTTLQMEGVLAVAVGINGHLAVGINDWFVDAASNFFGLSDQGSKMDSSKNECDFSRTSAAMLDIFG